MCFVKCAPKKKKLTAEERKQREIETAKTLAKVYAKVVKKSTIGKYMDFSNR